MIAAESENVYELEPALCIPDDCVIIGVSGDNVDVIEHNNYKQDDCCEVDDELNIILPPPEPTATPEPPLTLPPRAPYQLSIAKGSVVFAWFHNNAPPNPADYFDVYRSLDGVDYDFHKTIYARGTGIRAYKIVDENPPCQSPFLYYRVAARNDHGVTWAEETSIIPMDVCTPTQKQTP